MKHLNFLFGILMSCVTLGFAQQTPAPPQKEAFTIVGATAHIGNGKVINNSLIIVENGKISHCVDATLSRIPYKGTVIDAKGKHVYPGFIAANTTLGLVEVDAVRASDDKDEIGSMIPHIRSLIAYNAESKLVESMRPNGVLISQIVPRGGVISGTSSIVQLDAWNWEDAAVKVDEGIHLNWPSNYSRGRWWLGEPSGLRPNANYAKQLQNITDFVVESKAHLNGKRDVTNLAYEAMEGLFDGSKKLYVHVNFEKGIIDAVHFAKAHDIQNLVIVGGYEAHKAAQILKANNVPVLVKRVHSTPTSDDHDYDHPFKLAKLLHDNGIVVGLETSGQMERMNTRNLPFYAGQVVGQGLDKEDALKMITSNTAKILGIDKQFGTLETGKDATLFISEGDALDMRTNIISKAFINGRSISLETHQTKLWKRYSNKYKSSH